MVPGVPIAIQRRRRQCAIRLPDIPVGLTLAIGSMTGSTI